MSATGDSKDKIEKRLIAINEVLNKLQPEKAALEKLKGIFEKICASYESKHKEFIKDKVDIKDFFDGKNAGFEVTIEKAEEDEIRSIIEKIDGDIKTAAKLKENQKTDYDKMVVACPTAEEAYKDAKIIYDEEQSLEKTIHSRFKMLEDLRAEIEKYQAKNETKAVFFLVTNDKKLTSLLRSYKLTSESIDKITADGVPKDVVDKIKNLKNEYQSEEKFKDELKKKLGAEYDDNKYLILKNASFFSGEKLGIKDPKNFEKDLYDKSNSMIKKETDLKVAEVNLKEAHEELEKRQKTLNELENNRRKRILEELS